MQLLLCGAPGPGAPEVEMVHSTSLPAAFRLITFGSSHALSQPVCKVEDPMPQASSACSYFNYVPK